MTHTSNNVIYWLTTTSGCDFRIRINDFHCQILSRAVQHLEFFNSSLYFFKKKKGEYVFYKYESYTL